jgi:acylphosphatase
MSSEIPIKRARIRVQGVVQGVFFRASTQAKARALGLTGWVRNTPDGAVELQAQGPEQAMSELLVWCHHGPPAALVRDVAVHDEEPIFGERDFEVRR